MNRLPRMHATGRRLLPAILAAAFVVAIAPSPSPATTPPSGGHVSSDPITATQLHRGTEPDGLTLNSRFAAGGSAKAAPRLNGTLHFAGATMGVVSDAADGQISNPVGGKDTTFFPDVSIPFFTAGSHLVPTTQDVIRNGTLASTRSYWDVIVQPGRVWTQPGDHGWHRASFPFALVNSIEGETHTGIALFLYRGHRVSNVRFQIVQETAPYDVPEYFSAWGVSAASFSPGGDRLWAQRREFWASQHARLPERPWSDLVGKGADQQTLDAYASYSDAFQSGAVVDGTLYRTNCPTSAGPLPYCSGVRYGVWSVTKSALLDVAMMRLAQKYGRGIVNQSIAPYVAGAAKAGWRDVTFGDLADMASGRGPAKHPHCYLCDYVRWYLAPSEREKTAEALDYKKFTEAGTDYNYRDQDAYLLAVAEDGLLKSHEGPHASIATMLADEVYRPIGIYTLSTNRTIEAHGPGMPVGAYGYYPTLDDLAKIAALFENHGAWGGQQLLSRSLVSSLLPRASPPPGALESADGSEWYRFDWHIRAIESSHGCTRYLPEMEGWGGNTVTLLPGDATLLRMRNNWVGDPSDPQVEINALADQLAPICG